MIVHHCDNLTESNMNVPVFFRSPTVTYLAISGFIRGT